jgi:hypothetical protein
MLEVLLSQIVSGLVLGGLYVLIAMPGLMRSTSAAFPWYQRGGGCSPT